MIAIQPKSRQILGVNQQAYQALKAAMSLNLRRQLLVAVCDNVVLQNQLATQLENDLAQVSWLPPRGGSAASGGGSLALERLVFDPEDAHLPRQVAHWVRQTLLEEGSLPQVQVLGIEQMTRQPAIIQNHFLRSLEQVEALLPRLNTSLLVWVPWPWLRTIQSSSPTFWKWRNGVFEFVSDPTPALPTSEPRTLRPRALQNRPSAQSPLSGVSRQNTRQNGDRPIRIEDYPRIDPHQVVALYGETDDSETSDFGQPTLETIATWDTVDVAATTVHTSPVPQADAKVLARRELADFTPDAESTTEETSLLAAATAALGAHQSALQGETRKAKAERSAGEEGPSVVSQLLAAERLAAERAEAERVESERIRSQQALEQQVAVQNQPVQSQPVQNQPVQNQPVQNQPVQSQPVSAQSAQSQVVSAQPSSSIVDSQQVQRQRAADDYFEVGHRYRSRIEAGERGLDMIEPAIAAYEGALRCLSGPHPDWGSGLNDLGTLYWLKAQQLEDQQQVVDCMNHSVQLYSQALEKLDPAQSADMACQLYSNLGAVFSMLAVRIDPVSHFEQAAEAYLKALPFCPVSVDPQEFAILQNSLGSVYWKLSHYEQDKAQVQLYLQQAIVAYEQAALGYIPHQRPLDYAAVQNNLGITYWSLAKHENAVPALENAIAAYREALNYRTPETDAAACAITHNNLALSYWDLSKDDTVDLEHTLLYQRNAVSAFESALQTATGVGALSKVDSAAIYHCLGDVHAQMVAKSPSLTEVTDSLQKSLDSYIQAIDGVSMESPVFQTRLTAIVATLRSHKAQLGLSSQQIALNRVPAHLISLVMQAL